MKFTTIALCVSLVAFGAGDIENGDFGHKGSFAWDAPTLNTDGTPLTDLAGYVLACYRATEDPRLVPSAMPVWTAQVDPTVTTYNFASITSALKTSGAMEGSRWLFMVKAVDVAGNESAWSNSWAGNLNALPPAAPQNYRVLAK